MCSMTPRLTEAQELPEIKRLVKAAQALKLRALVAGWNGEDLPKPYTERHPDKLGVTLKTNCGVVYELDAALAAIDGVQP